MTNSNTKEIQYSVNDILTNEVNYLWPNLGGNDYYVYVELLSSYNNDVVAFLFKSIEDNYDDIKDTLSKSNKYIIEGVVNNKQIIIKLISTF